MYPQIFVEKKNVYLDIFTSRTKKQSTLVISTSLILNNCLSKSENLVPALFVLRFTALSTQQGHVK